MFMPARSLRRVYATLCALLVVLAFTGCATAPPQDDLGAWMKEGQELYAAKNYDQAIKRFKDVVAKDSKHWQAYLWLARAYIAKGLWGDAIASARTAYQLAASGQDVIPVLAEALFGGGSEALKANRFNDAISHFLDYIKLQPGNARAYLNVARAFLGEKRFADALAALLKGLGVATPGAERTEVLRALLDGGQQAFTQRAFRDAIGFLREYVNHDRGNLGAYLDLAKAYWQAGERGNALNAFRRVIELDPRHEEALRFLRGG
jgi:tetratricopeptide (TPR) repeat protein